MRLPELIAQGIILGASGLRLNIKRHPRLGRLLERRSRVGKQAKVSLCRYEGCSGFHLHVVQPVSSLETDETEGSQYIAVNVISSVVQVFSSSLPLHSHFRLFNLRSSLSPLISRRSQ